MNEKLNLVEILKDCPKGTKLYSTVYGEVEYDRIEKKEIYSIICVAKHGGNCNVTSDGKHYESFDGDCTLFPSKEQRDWSKFKLPQKERFDPKTLKPFDKVLARDSNEGQWKATFYSHKEEYKDSLYPYITSYENYRCCIPYNDETKHLIGTTEEAPEFYCYWQN